MTTTHPPTHIPTHIYHPQSQGTINASLFQAYQCQEGGGHFTVDLPILLECLQVFGAAALQNTMLTMAYEVRPFSRLHRLGLVCRVAGLGLVPCFYD